MQSILQLPVYLDRIQTARRDFPIVMRFLNDLRSARRENCSRGDESPFYPDMSGAMQLSQ